MDLVFKDMPDESLVWIFQSSKELNLHMQAEMQSDLSLFLNNWNSHQKKLFAEAAILYQHFVVVILDASRTDPSGCSIDKLVALVKKWGQRFEIDFFNRLEFAYLSDDKVEFISSIEMKNSFTDGKINDQTLFFNHLVKNKKEWLHHWTTQLSHSWHKNFI